jgi:hypothetical protein
MNKQLGEDDALAVDLVLDRTNKVNTNAAAASDGNGGDSAVFFTPVGDSVALRIGAVEAVLRVLNEMPNEDPPDDLAQRTLGRILQRPLTAGPHAHEPLDERPPA